MSARKYAQGTCPRNLWYKSHGKALRAQGWRLAGWDAESALIEIGYQSESEQLEEMRRQLTAAQQALASREWQPIETAPKAEEVPLLLWSLGAVVGKRRKEWDCWVSIPGLYQLRPTHWLPLPEPPMASGKRGAGEGEA